jgi:hypothetical protein
MGSFPSDLSTMDTSANSTLAIRLEGTYVWKSLLPYISTVPCKHFPITTWIQPTTDVSFTPTSYTTTIYNPLNPNQQHQVSINANQQPQNQAAHNPPRPTTIPAQLVPNPNNQPTHLVQNTEVQTFPTYEIQLRW